VVAVWSAQQRNQQAAEVESFVAAECEAAMAGSGAAGQGPAGDFVTRTAREQLRAALAGVDRSNVSVTVETGEPPATHHAVIAVGGRPVLGLRLVHDGSPGGIVIIGYWIP